MLTIDSLTIEKNQQIIFKNLGFSIGLGSFLILAGQNGSGKTTLLKTIAGLCAPSSGDILWNGENVKNFHSDFTSDINYIGHKNFLKPKLSVVENMEFYAKLSETEILIPSALHYFELEDVAQKSVYQLSSGMQKKVLLAKLIYSTKTLWLLDEPTVNLDKIGKEKLMNLIETRVKEGGIVIVSTHDHDLFSLKDKASGKIVLEDFK